jgi:uncharacterized protein YbjQ (UPF0145 family)
VSLTPSCPRCGKFVKGEESVCPHCGFKAEFAELARQDQKRRDALHGVEQSEADRIAAEEARIREQVVAIPVVTLQYMPGHKVKKVVGVITSEVVLGTGLLTEVSTVIADFLGTRGSAFEAKWKNAKETALYDLRWNAYELGCNAVLGLDMELATVRDIPMIIVTGTGVVLGEQEGEESDPPAR